MSGHTTGMLNLTAKKLMAVFPDLVKPICFFSNSQSSFAQCTNSRHLSLGLSGLSWQFFQQLKLILTAICPDSVSLPRLFFGIIVTLSSLLSVNIAHADTDFSYLTLTNTSHTPPSGLRRISHTASYRIHMLPSLQQHRSSNSVLVGDSDKNDETLSSTTAEVLEMDKVELASLQVMQVLNDICPSLLPASQHSTFQRAFDTRLRELLPNVTDPQAVMQALSTQRTYRRELNSLKSWLNGLSKNEKSVLCREIAIATL